MGMAMSIRNVVVYMQVLLGHMFLESKFEVTMLDGQGSEMVGPVRQSVPVVVVLLGFLYEPRHSVYGLFYL